MNWDLLLYLVENKKNKSYRFKINEKALPLGIPSLDTLGNAFLCI